MRLLHTSDLHYGHVWRGVPRLEDQNRVLDEILGICEPERVDVLLIAGDVLSHRVDGSMASIARQLLERLAPALRRGMGVFLLWGNHDNRPLFQLIRTLTVEMEAGAERWPLVIADQPAVYELPGQQHVVIGLPYLSMRDVLTSEIAADLSPEEQAALASGQLSQWLQRLYQQLPPGRPAIFATHLLVEGFYLNEDEETCAHFERDLRIRPSDLPHFTSYNALGHIHKLQPIRGAAKPTWYSGGPDRHDLGERAYTPAVLLVDLPDTPGGEANVTQVPIQGTTPFVKEILDGPEAVAHFCESVPDTRLLGEVTVCNIPVSERGLAETRLRAAAPRLILHWTGQPGTIVAASGEWTDPSNPRAIVRSYLEDDFTGTQQEREQLLAAFEELMAADEVSLAEASA